MHAKTSSGFECGVKIKKFEVQEEKAQNLTVSAQQIKYHEFANSFIVIIYTTILTYLCLSKKEQPIKF